MRKLDFRRKNQLLLAGVLIFGFLIWKMTIAKTIDIAGQCAELELKVAQADNAYQTISNLESNLAEAERHFGAADGANDAIPEEMYDYISRYCQEKGVTLQNYPEPHHFDDPEHHIETEKIVVEGGFSPMLQLLHNLESEFGKARVASVRFYAEADKKTKEKKLYAEFYLQSIRKA